MIIYQCFFYSDWKEFKPKIARKPPRSHSGTGNAVGRPPSLQKSLEQIDADLNKAKAGVLSKYPEEIQRYDLLPCPFLSH